MSAELKQKMKDFPDIRILNTIKQADNFPADVVAMAKEVALERQLATSAQIENFERYTEFKKMANESVRKGDSPATTRAILERAGADPDSIREIIDTLQRTAESPKWTQNTGAVGIGAVGVLYLIYVIIKIIYRVGSS